MHTRLLHLAAAAMALCACADPSGSPPPSADRSPAANASPSPMSPSERPRPTAAASPLASQVSERERSEAYWQAVSDFGRYSFTYDSLAEITADAHLVVLGRVIDVEPGQIESFETPPGLDEPSARPVIFGVVAVDEVLKGQPVTRVPGQVLVARMGRSGMTAADLPIGRVILFLKNHAQLRAEEGYEVSPDAADRFYYARPNGYQCVLRDIDRRVRIIDGPAGWVEALGPFPSPLDGRLFEDVLDRVRDLADDG